MHHDTAAGGRALWGIALALACSVACSGSKPTAPAPVATPPVTATLVAVSGSPPAIGASAQFTAVATLSDGSTRDVTRLAQWASTAPAVATVSNEGVVVGRSAGSTDVTATYEGVTGRRGFIIAAPPTPARATLRGTVTDGTSRGVLPGISIDLLDSSLHTASTVTDPQGSYVFTSLPLGAVSLTASAAGYATLINTVSVGGDTVFDFVLQRKPPSVLTITSSPGEFIMNGQSLRVEEGRDRFIGQMVDQNRQMELQIWLAGRWVYSLNFAAPPGQQLTVGNYPNATALPYDTAMVSFSGNGRGCGQFSSGELTVLDAVYGPPQSTIRYTSGRIERFHARFTQRCPPTGPPLTGEIWLYGPLPLATGR